MFRSIFIKEKIVLFFIVVSLILGCKENNVDKEPLWTFEDTIEEFNQIDITAGATSDVTLHLPGYPYEWKFRVIVPENLNPTGVPLVMALHGGANNTSPDLHKNTDCYIEPGLKSLNAIIISPNSQSMQWYEQTNIDQIMNLASMALQNWPINEDEIAVVGYSDGGNGSWFFSEFFHEMFSVGIAVSSSYNTKKTDSTGRTIETPLYVIHSTGDELFPLEQTQEWVTLAQEAGGVIEFEIAENLSHYKPCDYVPYFERAATWVNDSIWNK